LLIFCKRLAGKKKFTKFLQFSYKIVTSVVYNGIEKKNKDGESLACWALIIEQGRSSVQQALLPFYFGGSEFDLFTGLFPKGRKIGLLPKGMETLAFARTPREDPRFHRGTPGGGGIK
jgi:hypothetical protein